jgi:hypothetical protein
MLATFSITALFGAGLIWCAAVPIRRRKPRPPADTD